MVRVGKQKQQSILSDSYSLPTLFTINNPFSFAGTEWVVKNQGSSLEINTMLCFVAPVFIYIPLKYHDNTLNYIYVFVNTFPFFSISKKLRGNAASEQKCLF